MHLTFSPVRRDDRLALTRTGDILTINGEDFDFAPLPDGAILPRAAIASDWIAGDVTRERGVLHIPLILPHGANAPEAARFPAPITLESGGPVTLPAHEADPEMQA